MYALSFRKKALDLKEQEHLSFEALGKRFAIHPRTMQRWKQRMEPKVKRAKSATKIDMEALEKHVQENPDAYQWERAEQFQVTQSAIFYALKRLGRAIKKTLYHPKADEFLRAEFQEAIEQYTTAKQTVIYLDESGFAHDMPRTHGYSSKGKRCYGEQDWHARGRANVIGAIENNKLFALRLFDCNIDSDVFFAWLTKALIPELPQSSVVVMDNATFHKRSDMKKTLESQGHILLFLPPYSPDLNPIEHKWAHAKALRRQQRCSTQELFSVLNITANYFDSAISWLTNSPT